MDAQPHDPQPAGASPRWYSLDELSAESGLNRHLITQFVPASSTPTGPIYGERQFQVAQVVKAMTDNGLPASVIHAAVQELWGYRVGHGGPLSADEERRVEKRTWVWMAVAAAALVVGGVAGALIAGSGADSAGKAAETVTVTPPEFTPTIPAAPDAVCPAWSPISADYRAKLAAWAAVDPNIAAAQWNPEQRGIAAAAQPLIKAEADDMRRLADMAKEPYLKALMRTQAEYEEAFAGRLMDYRPEDGRLWRAAMDFNSAVASRCAAVASG